METLIAGLQALLWLALGLLLFLGVRWIDFSALKDRVSLILFFVIAVAYTLGIIFLLVGFMVLAIVFWIGLGVWIVVRMVRATPASTKPKARDEEHFS